VDALRKVVLFPIKVQGYSQSPSFMLVCIFYWAGGALGLSTGTKALPPALSRAPAMTMQREKPASGGAHGGGASSFQPS